MQNERESSVQDVIVTATCISQVFSGSYLCDGPGDMIFIYLFCSIAGEVDI